LGCASIWFFLAKAFITTHALLDDWFNHAKYFWVFAAGLMLPQVPQIWQRLVDGRRVMLILTVLGYIWLLMDRYGLLNVGETLDKLWWIQFVHNILISINHWAWIVAIVGYAGRYLQFSNGFLHYANQAILTWYISHQTVIVIFAVYLSVWQMPVWIEALLLILITSVVCLLGYEIVRRSRLLKVFFGVK
jgi:glucan biosynthesis protein C